MPMLSNLSRRIRTLMIETQKETLLDFGVDRELVEDAAARSLAHNADRSLDTLYDQVFPLDGTPAVRQFDRDTPMKFRFRLRISLTEDRGHAARERRLARLDAISEVNRRADDQPSILP